MWNTLQAYLAQLEAARPASCLACGDGIRFRWVIVGDDDPEAEPVCPDCGRPVALRIIHITGVAPADV